MLYFITQRRYERGDGVSEGRKIVAENRKARHDYFILDRFEAGISLRGTEVKSIRLGNVNLKEAFCLIKEKELFVQAMHISPYEQGNLFNTDPLRVRKLLMHRQEIARLSAKVQQDGLTLVPLRLYLKGPYIKMDVGLCKGKKMYDKRDTMAQRDAKRNIDRSMKEATR